VAFLDRINIGFAALTMNRELGITSSAVRACVRNFLNQLRRLRNTEQFALAQDRGPHLAGPYPDYLGSDRRPDGFVQSLNQLYMARFLLGLAEGGYFPGILLYLTYWFRQRDQAQALSFFLMGIPITNIAGAPLSGLILDYIHWFGLSSWRWLLILEGIPAIVCGVLNLLSAPKSSGRSRVPYGRGKGWDYCAIKRGRTYQAGNSFAFGHDEPWSIPVSGIWRVSPLPWHCSLHCKRWLPQMVKSFSASYSNSVSRSLVMVPNVVGLLFML
jgi:MFS family permease